MGSFDMQDPLQGRRADIHASPLVAFRRVRCWEPLTTLSTTF
jgi:hypothetical protein